MAGSDSMEAHSCWRATAPRDGDGLGVVGAADPDGLPELDGG